MSQKYEAYVILSRGHPPACEICGNDKLDYLVIDHRARDGGRDRKSGLNTNSLYGWILKNPDVARGRLRVLCANCNMELERRHYRGEDVYVVADPSAALEVLPLWGYAFEQAFHVASDGLRALLCAAISAYPDNPQAEIADRLAEHFAGAIRNFARPIMSREIGPEL